SALQREGTGLVMELDAVYGVTASGINTLLCHRAAPSHPKGFSLALASWCASFVIKQPCEPVPVTSLGAHGPDAKRRVHRCAARLPARPGPAPLVATNSSPGVCS